MKEEKDFDEELIQLAMQILVHSGDSRKKFVEAMDAVAAKDLDLADKKLKEANDDIVVAHGLQTETLQKEASGEDIRYSTLFSHAQDTMMTVKSEILIGEQIIKIVKSYSKEEQLE